VALGDLAAFSVATIERGRLLGRSEEVGRCCQLKVGFLEGIAPEALVECSPLRPAVSLAPSACAFCSRFSSQYYLVESEVKEFSFVSRNMGQRVERKLFMRTHGIGCFNLRTSRLTFSLLGEIGEPDRLSIASSTSMSRVPIDGGFASDRLD
jgi:hypothetical protein